MNIKQLFFNSQIAWTADLEYWISGRELDGTGDAAWRTEEGYLELCGELGIIPYYWYQDFWAGEPVYTGDINIVKETRDTDILTKWNTPVGSITEHKRFMLESCSWGHVKYPVCNYEDLKVFAYIVAHRKLATAVHLSNYHKRLKLWQQYGGTPSVSMPRSPLAAFFYEWAGVVDTVYLMMDHLDMVKEIFTAMAEQEASLIESVAKLNPMLLHFADNISADNMAGYFDEYIKPVYEKRLAVFHESDIFCAVHLDGVVNGIIDKVASTGVDAIEALTPRPGGDMNVEDMRNAAGKDDVVLWGGVPGVMFREPYSEKDLLDQVEKVIEAWRGSPFVLGVADQVPADGDINRVKSVSRLVKDYNKGVM